MDNYKLNENVKKGKELLRGFGGKALQLGSGAPWVTFRSFGTKG
jgi:hypothetical protein